MSPPVTCPRCRGKGNVTSKVLNPLTREAVGSRTAPCALCEGKGELSWARSANSSPVARRTDPETSHAAAASIEPGKLRESQRAVRDVLELIGPATDERIAASYATYATSGLVPKQSSSGLRTRRRELTDLGLVHDTGARERLASGRQAIVWALGPPPTTQEQP